MREQMTRQEAYGQQESSISPSEFFERSQRVLDTAFRHFDAPEHQEELEKARSIFFLLRPGEELILGALKPIDHHNFKTWFLCDYDLAGTGQPPLLSFLESTPGSRLSPQDRDVALMMADSHLSLYDLVSIDRDTSEITLRDIFTMKSLRVLDPRLAKVADSMLFFAFRLVKINGLNYSTGDMFVYPGDLKERFLMVLQSRLMEPAALVPPTLKDMLRKKGFIFNHLQMALRNTDDMIRRKEEPPPMPQQEKSPAKEKPRATLSRAHFMVDDHDATRTALEGMKSIRPKESAEGSLKYSWHRTVGGNNPQEEDGEVILKKGKLLFETMGEDSLDAGRSELSRALKGRAKHMYDELEKRRIQ